MDLSNALITGQGIKLSEALATGGMVTGLGLIIVFAVLVILMLVLMLFKVIFARNTEQPKPVQAAPAAPAAAPAPAAQNKKDDMDEEELIAVLTAAVAASLNTSTYNLKIKSYRRIDDKKPAWNKAGVRETINSRF